ncbi:MAG: methionyl-tRNA formyltransferase [Bacillota bacterium]
MQITGHISPPDMHLKVVTIGDSILERPAAPVTRFNRSLGQLLDRMAATMYHERGVGLAAVQVGESRRAVVVDLGEGPVDLVNPEITHRRGASEEFEGCLSVPGYTGKVTRPEEVTVSAQDRSGEKIWLNAEGMAARILCHEIDHLEGRLFVDIAEDVMPMNPETRLRVVFMGTPEFAAIVLARLLRANCRVVGAVTAPDRRRGRGQKVRPTPVKELALEHNITVLQPEPGDDEELARHLRWLDPDVIVTAAYGRILDREVLDIPELGCLNVHASLLPRYRGAAPIQRQLLAGEEETGVSIIRMDEGMDTGPILAQREMEVRAGDDAGSLHDRLAFLGGNEVVTVLRELARGESSPRAQDHELATYAPKIGRDETEIDWSGSATGIVNQIRAFSPRPGAWTLWRGERIRILRASPGDGCGGRPGEVIEVDPGGIRVATGDGACVLERVQVAGRQPTDVADFVNGYDMKPGEILGGVGGGSQ